MVFLQKDMHACLDVEERGSKAGLPGGLGPKMPNPFTKVAKQVFSQNDVTKFSRMRT